MSAEPPLSTLRLEDGLLLRCARAGWSPAADPLSHVLSRDVDWSYLSWSAEAHGILPLLSWHLERCGWTMVPDRVRDSLSLASRENERRALLASAWIGSTAALLESEGIPVLITRGASSRLVSEIDMLVRKPHLAVARQVLASRGCANAYATPGTTTARERMFVMANHGYVLGAEGVDVPINLRYSITPSSFPVSYDIERMFHDAHRIAVGDSTILFPSASDLALTSCLRGTLHLWKRLSDLVDLAELIGEQNDLDWDALLAQAQRERCSSAVSLGLVLATSRLGVELPARVQDRIGRDARANAIARAVSARPFTAARRVPPVGERLRFHLALRDTFGQKIEQCLTVAIPGPQDAPASAVPAWLDPVYYVVRPLRYAVDLVKRVAGARPQRPQWSGTPIAIVDRMLHLARAEPSDYVCDLGCGEGRILIRAATHFGARGVGVDVDEVRLEEARRQARQQGVGDRVSFEGLDAFDADLRSATLVTLTLAPQWNDRIAPKLRAELPAGARVVALNTDIAGWEPQDVEIVRVGNDTCRLYLWEIDRQRGTAAHT